MMPLMNSKMSLFAQLRLKELVASKGALTSAEYIALMAKAMAETVNVDHAEVVCPFCEGACDEESKYCPNCKECRGEWKLVYKEMK